MTWICEFRPGNKTIYVVFDEESDFSGPRSQFLRPDQVFYENVPYKKIIPASDPNGGFAGSSNSHFLGLLGLVVCKDFLGFSSVSFRL